MMEERKKPEHGGMKLDGWLITKERPQDLATSIYLARDLALDGPPRTEETRRCRTPSRRKKTRADDDDASVWLVRSSFQRQPAPPP
ncbi:hypothetical protein TgHK011_004458 [Trichoderma gracile]|nr:hypothetical protein TgHK011_004458 [Trichoderma gracile]